MKIGIVTVHDSNNYGSFLQAYALQRILNDYGHDVYFARTRDKKLLKSIFIPKILKKQLLKHPIRVVREHFIGIKKQKAFLEDQKIFKEIDVEDLPNMDLVILGSDEIWNTKVSSFQREHFYGKGLDNVMTYAVSVGNATLEDVWHYENIVNCIKKISCILVRDFQTQKIIEMITGNKPSIVCDPTFLVKPVVFHKSKKTCYMSKEKYLLIYSYGIGKELKNIIRKFAHENNFKIVSACFYYSWADENVMCGPLDFCDLMERASFVITTTFHGTIFSVLNQKQFVSFPASIKTTDLLNRLGISDRLMNKENSYEQISEALKKDIDYDEVNSKISEFREKSLPLLLNNLKNYGR